MTDEPQQIDEGQLLREHLFDADLLQLPAPEEGIPGFLPEWFTGELPVLVYPPLSERGVAEGENINLEVSPYHLYYGALRELAETADEERGELLHRVIQEWNPNAAMEVCQLGREQIEADVEKALLHYELALELDPNLYEAAQDGGMCEFALAAVAGEGREERLDAAEELFRQALELRPDAGLSCWSLARVMNDQGRAEEAHGVLVRYLEDFPEGEERRWVEEALENGFESPEVVMENAEGESGEELTQEQQVFLQAQALAFGEDAAQAVKLLEPLAETYPDSPEIWFLMGAANRRSGHGEEAERCLRRAARLSPDEPFIWLELAQAYLDAQQWSAAENAIRRSLEKDPENAGFLVVLGRCLLRQGKREEAEEALHQAQDLVPDDPEVIAALEELEASRR